MDIRQMEYFQMVCRLNNLTRAAERLHVAQPAVSVAIQKLEDELGVQLFDRSQKQLVLTTEGKVFLERVEDILQRTQDAVLEMHEYRELRKGGIKLGVPPMIGAYIFPHIFAGFKQVYPALNLSVVEDGSLAIRDRLEKEELDLGIVITSDLSPRLEMRPITQGEVLLCLSPLHHLANAAAVSIADLRDEPFILLKEDTYHRKLVLDECKKHGFEPHIVLSSSQIETIKGLVAKGVGISFLLDVIARKDNYVHCLPLAAPLHIEIGLVWKKERYLSKASQAFIDFMGTLIP